MDSVTIIIPCYNQAHWLPDAIESALSQTIPCDVIVVNDGSPDNTSSVAQNYAVRLIEKENGGLSSARNAGIRKAKTTWVLTLDADDKIAPDFVEKCLAKAKTTNADIIGTGQQEFGDSNRQYQFLDNPSHEDFRSANRINCCSLFKKEIWESIQGYDENMKLGYEDWDFWLRATQKGYKVSVVNEFLFFYRKHGISMVTTARKHHKEIVDYMHSKLVV